MTLFRHIKLFFGKISAILTMMMVLSLWSCTDDPIPTDGDNTDSPMDETIEGYSIGFKVKLDRDLTTRADGIEAYDNYIDTRDKFRVLFFTHDGDFLFGAVDRTIMSLTDQNDYTGSDTWYVRVPMNYLVDRDGNVYDVEAIKNYLRANPFKVAVLANWPNVTKTASDDEEWTYINREPNWGYYNSLLCDDKNNSKYSLKNINDLHHLVKDSNYNNTSNLGEENSNRPARIETYDFVMDGDVANYNGTMGVKTDWVEMINSELQPASGEDGRAVADAWIRKNWDPSTNSSSVLDSHYDKLWMLWNFGGNRSPNSLSYTKSAISKVEDKYLDAGIFTSEWKSRNTTFYNTLFKDFNNDGEIDNKKTYSFDNGNLIFVSNEAGNSTGDDNVYESYTTTKSRVWITDGGWYGVQIDRSRKIEGDDTNHPRLSVNDDSNTSGYFKFKVSGTGTLRIIFGSKNNSGQAKVAVQLNSTYMANTGGYASTDPKGWEKNIDVTDANSEIYIFSMNETPAVIYGIEWISNKYLYDTDRHGIAPSEEQPIPMYGVQDFSKLSGWEEGTTYDLTASDNIQPITLIRSLAKVVVYLPQQASYIYMRSMNRTARCEPIDVETPTSTTWSSKHDNSCEFFTISNHDCGFLYKQTGADPSNKDELKAYTQWLSWFYGSWRYDYTNKLKEYNPWDFDSHNKFYFNGSDNINNTLNSASKPFPRIFYPDINRSDFCRMIECGYTEKGWKYIMYMPEKNIIDPNNVGNQSSVAKVAHIEYRYADTKMSKGAHLEDDDCYRIYFTDYSSNSTIKTQSKNTYESSYEKSQTNLQQHWPIMRNHIYEFQVKGTNTSLPATQTIQVSVGNWGDTSREVVEW